MPALWVWLFWLQSRRIEKQDEKMKEPYKTAPYIFLIILFRHQNRVDNMNDAIIDRHIGCLNRCVIDLYTHAFGIDL